MYVFIAFDFWTSEWAEVQTHGCKLSESENVNDLPV